jgi:hypothetical protein
MLMSKTPVCPIRLVKKLIRRSAVTVHADSRIETLWKANLDSVVAHFESGTGVPPVKSRARCACHLKLGHYLDSDWIRNECERANSESITPRARPAAGGPGSGGCVYVSLARIRRQRSVLVMV